MQQSGKRDHGGDLAEAAAIYGGRVEDWLDLSTGINPLPYGIEGDEAALHLPARVWARLPGADRMTALCGAARRAYNPGLEAVITPAAGAQALIQILPMLRERGRCVVVSPTYNEHAAAFRAAGWEVTEQPEPEPAEAVVIVNPNNPDGRRHDPDDLMRLAGETQLLIVDESFADVTPETSLAREAGPESLVILKSLGKFYGLAGARVGFALSGPETAQALAERLGPWPVAGPSIEIAIAALNDRDWAGETRMRLRESVLRLDGMLTKAGMRVLGGTDLFRLVDVSACGGAAQVQDALAARHIRVRAFPFNTDWLRFGLPGPEEHWARLAVGLGDLA